MRFYMADTPEITTGDYLKALEARTKAPVNTVLRVAGKVDWDKNTQGIPEPDLHVELGLVDGTLYPQECVDAFFALPEVQDKLRQAFALQVELERAMAHHFDMDNIMDPFRMAMEYPMITKPGG